MISKVIIPVSFCFMLLLSPAFTALEHTPTIVVLDGKALLVDLNDRGEIVTTYMEVPEYFDSSKDHHTKVKEATANYKRLSVEQMDQIRFISLADDGWDLDEFMKSNLADLATHYRQTYANQIVITAAKHKSNQQLLDQNLQMITNILESYGVSNGDIQVNYKIDMGEEPTRFIKVACNLKTLASAEK